MTGEKDKLRNYIDNQNVVTDITEFWEEIAKILEELATAVVPHNLVRES